MQCNISRYISALMLVIFILVVMCYASIYQLRTSSLTVWKFDAVFTFFCLYMFMFSKTQRLNRLKYHLYLALTVLHLAETCV